MAKSNNITNPIFQDAERAREWLEARLWKDGAICPHCGVVGEATAMKGKSHRPGLYQCNACREPFTVTVGTLYERSHIPLNKWLAATYLLMSSKKGMSALQIGRTLGISKKSSWFLCHRIRESLREGKFDMFGQGGAIVEMDETYFGRPKEPKTVRADGTPFLKNYHNTRASRPIVSLVERGGRVRSFHVPSANLEAITKITNENLSNEARLFTDESRLYYRMKDRVSLHETVVHSKKEYARGNVHTNTIEGFFSIFKRGMKGNYQHCAEKHLHRYLSEFDYRYNHREALGFDDVDRFEQSIPGIVGKRLTYRRTRSAHVPF